MRWCVVAVLIVLSACQASDSTGAPDGGTSGNVTVGFTAASSQVDEASAAARVSVTLSSPSASPVTIQVITTGASAAEADDFVDVETDVIIPAGRLSAEITVTIEIDELEEPDENFTVELLHADGATLGIARHEVTIAANRRLPLVFVASALGTQVESTSGTIAFRLSEATTEPVELTYALSGTASAADAQLQAGMVTIPPGELQVTLELGVVDDNLDELDETLVVTIASAKNAVVGAVFAHSYTIVDNDASPTIAVEQYNVHVEEGHTGTKMVEVKVLLSSPSAAQITVPFEVHQNVTASTPSDYTVLTSSPLIFAPGQTATSIWVAVAGDTVVEGFEYAAVSLRAPVVQPASMKATLGFYTGAGINIDDDDCLGTGSWAVCPDAKIGGDIVVSTGHMCSTTIPANWLANGQPAACFIIGRNITVNSAIVGGPPVVLAATESITITGTLDVSWAGSNYPDGGPPCAPFAATPEERAGGAGGSFMTVGGNGGAHTSPNAAPGLAGAAQASAPTTLRAGCWGQRGGGNYNENGPIPFGMGGGAVYLVAGTSITLQPNAAINASGHIGRGTAYTSGGGNGGGSGGMIYLHAPTITATNAFLTANGGAGGEGAAGSLAGTDGLEADPRTPFVPAAGGSGTTGGDGGRGFAQGSSAASGAPATSTDGAGGGGGGAGYIHANQPLTGAFVSPAPS